MDTNIDGPGKKKKIRMKVVQVGDKPVAPSSHESTFKSGTEKRTFIKKDVRTGDPAYGKESSSAETPEFVRKAQSAGATHAEHNGKSYKAGDILSETTPHKIHTKIKINPSFKMVVPVDADDDGAGKDRISQKSGPAGKRRLERVAWLQGRNKRTESGYGR